MRKLLLGGLAVLLLLVGCVPSSVSPNGGNGEVEDPPNPNRPVVYLAQSIIDAAVAEAGTKTSFGLHLGKVRINYALGVEVVAAMVLHNGDDAERLIYVSYLRPPGQTDDADTGLVYERAPISAYGWVSIDVEAVRLKCLETVVIPVSLYVPEGTENLPERWEFDIWAQGITINEFTYECIVTTIEDDTVLEVHLPEALLQGSLDSILSLESTIEEDIYPTSYDPTTGILRIEGLVESAERVFTIRFEYGEAVAIGYAQRWLVTMLK